MKSLQEMLDEVEDLPETLTQKQLLRKAVNADVNSRQDVRLKRAAASSKLSNGVLQKRGLAVSTSRRPQHSDSIKADYRKALQIGPTKGGSGKASIRVTARALGLDPHLACMYYQGKFLDDLS